MVALTVNAQTTLKIAKKGLNNGKQTHAERLAGGGNNSVQAIAGTLTCNTQYVAGTTMNLDFVLELTNTDAEYGDSLDITFPAGFTINSTTNTPNLGPDDADASSDGPEAFNGISGQNISWGNNDNNYGGIVPQGATPPGPGTYPITINVTIGAGVTGPQVATFNVSGDGFGAGPLDLDGAICNIFPLGFNLIDGEISLGGPQTLTACGNASLPIAIRIMNNGTDSIKGLEVSYNVNGVGTVTELLTDTILVGDSLDYQFTATYDFSAEGTYEVRMWTTVAGEFDPTADTLTVLLENTVPVALTTTTALAPYANGIEAADLLGLTIQNGALASPGSGWGLSQGTFQSGAQALFLTAAIAGGGVADSWVFLKCMNVVSGDVYRITYWKRTNTNFNGGINIAAGASNDVASMLIPVKPFVANTANSQWSKDSVDMAAPLSGTVYLGFHGSGTATGNGSNVRLDNIKIWKVPAVGVTEINATDAVSIFPNPNAGVFTVKATENNSSVAVYSIIGENVYSAKLAKGNNSIDLTNLAAGSYIVKVNNGGTLVTKRVVINK